MAAHALNRHVALTGFMGAGKSTALAELRSKGLQTADADRLIEAEAGQSVAEIFEASGESGFREIEQRVVLAALKVLVVLPGKSAVESLPAVL